MNDSIQWFVDPPHDAYYWRHEAMRWRGLALTAAVVAAGLAVALAAGGCGQ